MHWEVHRGVSHPASIASLRERNTHEGNEDSGGLTRPWEEAEGWLAWRWGTYGPRSPIRAFQAEPGPQQKPAHGRNNKNVPSVNTASKEVEEVGRGGNKKMANAWADAGPPCVTAFYTKHMSFTTIRVWLVAVVVPTHPSYCPQLQPTLQNSPSILRTGS